MPTRGVTSHSGAIALGRLRRRQAKYETESHGSDLVFSTLRGTAMLRSNICRIHFSPMLERARIERSRSATCVDHQQVSARPLASGRAMADRLGRATTRMTMEVYTQVMQGMQVAAAAAIDGALAPPKRRKPRPASEKRPESKRARGKVTR